MLRSGDTARILGFKAEAPSTLGTFLRSDFAGTTSASWTPYPGLP